MSTYSINVNNEEMT